MNLAHAIPDAWPLLLTEQQLSAYLGGMDIRTIRKICPVSPLDMGRRVLRYRRPDIDAWVSTLSTRLPGSMSGDNTTPPPAREEDVSKAAAYDPHAKARARLERDKSWKKTG